MKVKNKIKLKIIFFSFDPSSSPSSERPGSNLSGIDADKIYNSVHSSVFTASTAPDDEFPPPLNEITPPPTLTPGMLHFRDRQLVS